MGGDPYLSQHSSLKKKTPLRVSRTLTVYAGIQSHEFGLVQAVLRSDVGARFSHPSSEQGG